MFQTSLHTENDIDNDIVFIIYYWWNEKYVQSSYIFSNNSLPSEVVPEVDISLSPVVITLTVVGKVSNVGVVILESSFELEVEA